MPEIVITLLIGLLGGVSVGIQSPLGGAMGQKVGGTASSFILHVSGAIFSGVLLLWRGGEEIRAWRTLPWYMLGAGVLGLVLFLTLTHTIPRLGASAAITLIIVGQLIMGMIIDQFGLFGVPVRPVDWMRVVGMLLLLAGGYIMVSR